MASYVSCEALLQQYNTSKVYADQGTDSLEHPATWSYVTPCIDGQLQTYSSTDLWHNYTNTTFTSKAMDCSAGCYLLSQDHPIFNKDYSFTFNRVTPAVESYYSDWISIIWDQAPTGPPGIPKGVSVSYRTVQVTWQRPTKMHPEFPVLEYKISACVMIPVQGYPDCVEMVICTCTFVATVSEPKLCLCQRTSAVPHYSDYDYTLRYYQTVSLGGLNYFAGYTEDLTLRYVNCHTLLDSLRTAGKTVYLTDGAADYEFDPEAPAPPGIPPWHWSGDYTYLSRCVDGVLPDHNSNDLYGSASNLESSVGPAKDIPVDCSVGGCYRIEALNPGYATPPEMNYTFTFTRPYNLTRVKAAVPLYHYQN